MTTPPWVLGLTRTRCSTETTETQQTSLEGLKQKKSGEERKYGFIVTHQADIIMGWYDLLTHSDAQTEKNPTLSCGP